MDRYSKEADSRAQKALWCFTLSGQDLEATKTTSIEGCWFEMDSLKCKIYIAPIEEGDDDQSNPHCYGLLSLRLDKNKRSCTKARAITILAHHLEKSSTWQPDYIGSLSTPVHTFLEYAFKVVDQKPRRPMSCSICPRSFYSKGDDFVERHYCFHFADQLLDGRSSGLKCLLCDKIFDRRDKLVIHLGQGNALKRNLGGPGHGLVQQMIDQQLPGLVDQIHHQDQLEISTGYADPLVDPASVTAPRVSAIEEPPLRSTCQPIIPTEIKRVLASTERPKRLATRRPHSNSKIMFQKQNKTASKQQTAAAHADTSSAVPTAVFEPISDGDSMACFRCGKVVASRRHHGRNFRRVMYSHYVRHFRSNLSPFITRPNHQQLGWVCSLCGQKHVTQAIMERHVAIAHRVLDKLLPPESRVFPFAVNQRRQPINQFKKAETELLHLFNDEAQNNVEQQWQQQQAECPLSCGEPVLLGFPAMNIAVLKLQECHRMHSLCLHLLNHFRPQLLASVTDEGMCRLCGAQQRSVADHSWEPLYHVGVVHNRLRDLLPADVADLVVKKPVPLLHPQAASRLTLLSLAKQAQRKERKLATSLARQAQKERELLMQVALQEKQDGQVLVHQEPPPGEAGKENALMEEILAGSGDSWQQKLLRCPLPDCKQLLACEALSKLNQRSRLAKHLVYHYQAQLRLYIRGGCCMICGLRLTRRKMPTHIGTRHGILETLVPSNVAPLIATRTYTRRAVKSIPPSVAAASAHLGGVGKQGAEDSSMYKYHLRNHKDSRQNGGYLDTECEPKQSSSLAFKLLRCPLADCGRVMYCRQLTSKSSKLMLRNHLTTHYRKELSAFVEKMGLRQWSCRLCGRLMPKRAQLLIHVAAVHDRLKQLVPASVADLVGYGTEYYVAGNVRQELEVIATFVDVQGEAAAVGSLDEGEPDSLKDALEPSFEAEQCLAKEEVKEEDCELSSILVKEEFSLAAETKGANSSDIRMSTELDDLLLNGEQVSAASETRRPLKEEVQEVEEEVGTVCVKEEFPLGANR